MNRFKGLIGIAQALFLAVVIIVLGWKYFLRDIIYPDHPAPSAQVSHQLYSACLNDEVRWLRALTEIKNTGAVTVTLSKAVHNVARIAPAVDFDNRLVDPGFAGSRKASVDWPVVASLPGAMKKELDPGTDFSEQVDFFIDPAIQVVEVSSVYTDNAAKPWATTTIYDVGDASCP